MTFDSQLTIFISFEKTRPQGSLKTISADPTQPKTTFLMPQEKTILIAAAIFVIFSALSLLPGKFNERIESASLHFYFQMRGPRQLDDRFLLVHIGADDVKALGGYPITRDYYGYMAHALNELGAAVIGFNLLFNSADPRFPEYDEIMADFFRKAGNVCLPIGFFDLQPPEIYGNNAMVATGLIEPIAKLQSSVARMGFSNLGDEQVFHRLPLAAMLDDSVFYSFGLELARRYLGRDVAVDRIDGEIRLEAGEQSKVIAVSDDGRMWPNHFGALKHCPSMGFVDLLQIFSTHPDSIDLSGKIVIVDVTAPGIPALVATPFSDALPTSLLHATAAANILNGNYLKPAPDWLAILVLLLAVAAPYTVSNYGNRRQVLMLTAMLMVVLLVASFAFFYFANTILSAFYPLAAIISTTAALYFISSKQTREREAGHRQLLQQEIADKEHKLEAAKAELAIVQNRLINEAVNSEQLYAMAESQRQTVADLESKLLDLREYTTDIAPASAGFAQIICTDDSSMAEILQMVSKVAPDDIPVLITGETGTGKELIASAIHQRSSRKQAPFVAVNCGALPETLLESELFGHEKGSFTGAQARRKGRFELADGGTIFLDEITETSPAFQSRLLRVLQEGTFERLGGEQTLKTDLRVIAASNRDLHKAVQQNEFRSDLFYRLNGFPIMLPPLRERVEDIPLLAKNFLNEHDYKPVSGFSDRVMQLFARYAWPGNVRELQNVVRRSAILAQSEGRKLIQKADLPPELLERTRVNTTSTYQTLEEQILRSLRKLRFSRSAISETARVLGNRDRGTITEHFRGICFEHLVRANFQIEEAAKSLVGSDEDEVITKVEAKLENYLQNLQPLPPAALNLEHCQTKDLPSQFKGLPKKFHGHLIQVIEHLRT